MPKVNNTCARILTPKQVGPICWFMATFVAMFYSQRSRRKLLNASSGWNKKKELFTLLKHVLDDKYLKTASRESEDYKKFSDDTFGDILSLLYKENNKAFPYDRILIKNAFKALKAVVKKSPKKCEEGKVLNPATGRCILIKNALKALKAVVKKSPKKCEEGKVLNPATGRCILIKNALKALKAK